MGQGEVRTETEWICCKPEPLRSSTQGPNSFSDELGLGVRVTHTNPTLLSSIVSLSLLEITKRIPDRAGGRESLRHSNVFSSLIHYVAKSIGTRLDRIEAVFDYIPIPERTTSPY
uniref:Uncharacterized protein n=1 Tax=Cannabis sativa TaxID=3483 RepID=A0A803QAA6_CANSA